jgi:RNA polymerase sigma-70 factor (ECF subfamily)
VAAVTLVCGSRALAEDVVQEALARAWERSERGERLESAAAWVAKVALNLARSRWRRAVAERRAWGALGSPAPAPPDDAEGEDVRRALRRLPRRQREVTVLRYYGGLEVKEIARTLGVSEGTVKTSLHRARERLLKALHEPNGEGVPERGR